MTNSMRSRPASNECSVLPTIQVIFVLGQASCSARTTGTVWQVSPIAESRMTQSDSGGWANGSCIPVVSRSRSEQSYTITRPRLRARRGPGIYGQSSLDDAFMTNDLAEIRDAVARLCADFPGRYWRDKDHAREYPTEFVEALSAAGYLA